MNQSLGAHQPLSLLAKQKGITNWNDLLTYVRQLPYGRNKSRTDFSLVLSQGMGTCSSKHACMKAIAEENELNNVKLILCMFKMSEVNSVWPKTKYIYTNH